MTPMVFCARRSSIIALKEYDSFVEWKLCASGNKKVIQRHRNWVIAHDSFQHEIIRISAILRLTHARASGIFFYSIKTRACARPNGMKVELGLIIIIIIFFLGSRPFNWSYLVDTRLKSTTERGRGQKTIF